MVTNYFLTGMILQVVGGVETPTHVKKYTRKYFFGANFPKGAKINYVSKPPPSAELGAPF